MLTVMTLNLNYYGEKHGAWPARRILIREAIDEADPDVIALQAVKKSPELYEGIDQASQLAEALPDHQHVFFQPAMEFADGSVGGSALITRTAMAERLSFNLSLRPGLEDSNRRVLLGARFEMGAQSLLVFNAHFSWVEAQAIENVRETLSYIRREPGPAILLGDLNSAPESPAMLQFCKAGWTDAWPVGQPADPGHTFEAGQLFTRIDYVWMSQDVRDRLRSIRIVSRRDEENNVDLSDHLGLLAVFDL